MFTYTYDPATGQLLSEAKGIGNAAVSIFEPEKAPNTYVSNDRLDAAAVKIVDGKPVPK